MKKISQPIRPFNPALWSVRRCLAFPEQIISKPLLEHSCPEDHID